MTDSAQKQPFWETLGLPPPNSEISLAEYEALPDSTVHTEWHDGVVIYPNWHEETISPVPSLRHQAIVMAVIKLLLKVMPYGDLFTAPTDVRMGDRIVQPDVFWITQDSACVPQDQYFLGAPDLIVEVLSMGNTEHDRVTKFDLYETSGVREYWIVDPQEDYLEVYALDQQTFRRVGAFKSGQVFQSPVLNAQIPVKDIFNR